MRFRKFISEAKEKDPEKNAARKLSMAAEDASDEAWEKGTVAAHRKAIAAHKKAFQVHKKLNNKDKMNYHKYTIDDHTREIIQPGG
jgi:hypothetical protein